MQDDFEATAFRPDPVRFRNSEILDEQHVRIHRVPARLVDQAHLDFGSVQLCIE
jgi:hypothetical protein